MIVGTTTATIIKDGILWVLLFLSEIAFRWIPATFAVATGGTDPVVPLFLTSLEHTIQGASNISQAVTPVSTGVVLEGVHYDAAGNAIPIMPSSDAPNMNTSTVAPSGSSAEALGSTFATAWGIFTPISIFASLLLATGIIYSLIRFFQVRAAEKHAIESLAHRPAPQQVEGVPVIPTVSSQAERRWERIETQISSGEENDWRLAILEADIMLDELLDSLGYAGESVADKLREVGTGNFATIDEARDAHRVRNHIAHRGSTHALSQREAQRVIRQYHNVFKEFGLLK